VLDKFLFYYLPLTGFVHELSGLDNTLDIIFVGNRVAGV